MKAIVLSAHGTADNFRQVDMTLPLLRPGEVRIKNHAIAFNPIDVQIRMGSPAATPVAEPILGRDLSGTVDAVHDTVHAFRPGDEVYSYICKLASSGTYAEYVSAPEQLVALKPRRLSHEQAASIPVAAITASIALERTRADPSRSLFVIGGAGGVGSFVISLAAQLGLQRLVTTAGSAASRAYLTNECGLRDEQMIDYRRGALADQAISANSGAFDAVIDLVGGSALSAACRTLAVDGHLASATEAPGSEDFEWLFDRNASFHAIGAHADSLSSDRRHWVRYRDRLDRISQGIDNGSLRLPRTLNVGRLSVETVKRAHDLLERGVVQGKLVMSCR
jgi:NADPH:quinone reductase